MAFDPSRPFTRVSDEAGGFDPSRPFSMVEPGDSPVKPGAIVTGPDGSQTILAAGNRRLPYVPVEQHPFFQNTLAEDGLPEADRRRITEEYASAYMEEIGADPGAKKSFLAHFRNTWDSYNTIGADLSARRVAGGEREKLDLEFDRPMAAIRAELERRRETGEGETKSAPVRMAGALAQMFGRQSDKNFFLSNQTNAALERRLTELETEREKRFEEWRERRTSGLLEEARRQGQFAAVNSHGLLEKGAAVAGTVAAAVADPASAIPIARGSQAASLPARMGIIGAQGATINAAINPLIQSSAQERNVQEGFEVGQLLADAGLGFVGSAALNTVPEVGRALSRRFKVKPEALAGKTVAEAAEAVARDTGAQPSAVRDVIIEATFTALPDDAPSVASRGRVPGGGASNTPTARQAIDDALETGRPITPEQMQELSLVERRFLEDFPEFATEEGLSVLREKTRGVIGDDSALKTAERLGWTEDKVLALRPGTSLNKENQLAVQGVVNGSTRRLRAMQEKMRASDLAPDSAEYARMQSTVAAEAMRNLELWQRYRSVISEAGRSLQGAKVKAGDFDEVLTRATKFLSDRDVRPEAKEHLRTMIANWDGQDPDAMLSALRMVKDATFTEKLVEFATAVKLMGKQTQFVNVLSSLARQATMPLEDVAAAGVDVVRATATGTPRERFFSEAIAEVAGQVYGWKAVPYHLKKLATDEEYALRLRSAQDFYGKKGPAIRGRFGRDTYYDAMMDKAGTIIRLPFRGLSVGDIIVRAPTEMGATFRLATRDALSAGKKPGTDEFFAHVYDFIRNTPPSKADYIKNEANRALFQRDPESSFMRSLSRFRQEHPFTKLIVPFFRTINDLVKTFVEFSPAAPALKGVREQLRAGGGEASEALGRMVIGTAAMVPLVQHASEGNMTLAAPRDPAERDAFYREGKQPYSIKIGDSWYHYGRLAPLSFHLAAAATIAKAWEEGKDVGVLMADVLFGTARTLADHSFSSGVADLLEAINDPSKTEKWLTNFIAGTTWPNILAEEARATDPVVRDRSHPGGMSVQKAAESLGVEGRVSDFLAGLEAEYRARTPGLSKSLPARTNVWGQPILRPGDSYLERSFNPVRVSRIHEDMVDRELEAIGYKVGFPDRSAWGFEISPKDYRMVKEWAGSMAYSQLANTIQTDEWQQSSPRKREILADQAISTARTAARLKYAMPNFTANEIAKVLMEDYGLTSTAARELAESVLGAISNGMPDLSLAK